MTNGRLILLFAVLLSFTKCSVGTADVPKGSEQEFKNAEKINSLLKLYTKVYKLNIDGPNLNLTIGMTEGDILHYRRRGFSVDRLMIEMADYLDSIHLATVKVTNLSDLLKPVDTYTYNKASIRSLKDWKTKDPVSLYIMSMAYELDNDKYEELSSIARAISNEFEDEKKLNTFDPDFQYYVEKFVSEIYGNPEGHVQRENMENFYRASFDQSFKYIKPADVLKFTNYADSIYYLKKYPEEIKTLLDQRKNLK